MHIFSDSAKELKNPRTLAVAAILIAVNIVLDRLTIVVGPTLHIGVTFLTTALIGFLFGPVVGLYAGGVTDILAYFAYSKGEAFFFGFTVSAMLSGFIYGVFLYKRKLSIPRTALTMAAITVIVNTGLNSVWLSMMYDKAFIVLIGSRVVKELIMLPIDAALFYMVGNLVRMALKRAGIHIQ